jgi:hypothetical protein
MFNTGTWYKTPNSLTHSGCNENLHNSATSYANMNAHCVSQSMETWNIIFMFSPLHKPWRNTYNQCFFFLGGHRGTRTPKHVVNLTGKSKNFS